MEILELHIKNMICSRCSYIVEQELKALGVKVVEVRLGHAVVKKPAQVTQKCIEQRLKKFDFEVLVDPEKILVEQLKLAVHDFLRFIEKENRKKHPESVTLSEYLSKKVGKEYAYLSKAFSRLEGRPIEKYYIRLRIERVKELLNDGQLTLKKIASKLGYSSVHYLSAQFKKVTGMVVTEYKERINEVGRKSLHKV
jgi:AraC family transcriptional regulator